MFQKHVMKNGNVNNPKACEVCGIDIYTSYGLCKASVHYYPHICGENSKNCFVDFNSDKFFGLARIDVELIGNKKDWKSPTVTIKPQQETN